MQLRESLKYARCLPFPFTTFPHLPSPFPRRPSFSFLPPSHHSSLYFYITIYLSIYRQIKFLIEFDFPNIDFVTSIPVTNVASCIVFP